MNEEVLNDLYQRAVSEGYSKSREEFINLLHTNQEVFNDMYSYVQSKGYNKDQNSFSQLVGKSVEVPYSQPTEPVKKKEVTSMVSSSATTPSVSQEEPPKITDYLQHPAEETKIQAPYAIGKEPQPEEKEFYGMVPMPEREGGYKKMLIEGIEEQIGGAKGVGKGGMIGMSLFNELVTGIPEALYNFAAIPQNYIAAKTGWDIATNSEKFKKNLGIRNPALDYYQDETKRMSEELSKFNEEKYGTSSVSEAISNGDYSGAFALLGQGIAQSAPTSIALMAGGAMLTPAQLAGTSTVAFYGQKMEESMAENPDMPEIERNIKALGMAAAESVFSAIGTGQIGAVYKDIIKKEGFKNGVEVFKKGLIETYKSAIKKYPGTSGFLGEGLEEAATQITQNLISGRPAFEGAVDAFILGGGSGVMYTAPISLQKAKQTINDYVKKENSKKEISSILDGKNVELNNVFNVSKDDAITPEQIKIANTDKSRDIIKTDLQYKMKKGEMTPEDAKQAMYIFDKVQRVSGMVKDLDVDDTDKARIVNLFNERNNISESIKGKDDVLIGPQKKRIDEINNEIMGLVSKPRPKVEVEPKYSIDGVEYSKKDWIDKIGSMDTEQLKSAKIKADNAEKDAVDFLNEKTKYINVTPEVKMMPEGAEVITKKPEEYAVQEQAAGQVPVQPTTGVGEKVEEGKSTTGPEVVTEEGIEETVAPKVEEEVTPTVLANVENTSTALESVPVEEKMDLEFTQEDGTVSPVNGNERMLSDMYHKAVALPEDERTEPQKQVVSLVEQSLSNDIEVERLERELAKPEVAEGPVTTVGISISNDTEIENLKNTARSKAQEAKTNEEKQSAETKVKVLDVAQKAVKTLKSVLPDFDIVIHDNEDSYNAEMEKVKGVAGSRGNFQYSQGPEGKMKGRIDINLSKANNRTVAHEIAHGVLVKSFGENTKLFNDFRNRLSRVLSSDKNKELNDFANRYIDPKTGRLLDVNHEEFLAELTGMLEQQETSISVSTMQKIAALINEFVSTITGGKFTPFKDTKDTKDVVDFFNTVSGAIRGGKEVAIKEAKKAITPKVVSKAQEPEPTAAPKYVRDISVLITPATVRGFDTRTERIKDMSIKYDELVKEYASDKSEEKRIQIRELEDQILNDAQQEIIDEVNKIPGLAVKFSEPKMGLWKKAFEPSFNMTFSVTPQADTKKISDLLINFGEKYSQDAFILETQSEQHNDFVNGKIRMPLNEKDSNGLANYPQIIYTFAKPISDEKISELSTSLQANGIDAFSINNNELKISVLTFLSDEQTKKLSEDEQYTEKFRDFESKSNSAEKSVGDVLGRDALDAGKIVIKRSHYQGAVNEGTADATRRYDRSDILKPFQQGTTKVETLSKEFAELRKKQISGQKLTENEQARFNELEPIIQPVVQKTFETNKKLYDQAKNEVEEIAEKSIEDFDASISPFPIKKPERASVKTLRWYSGLTENLGDGARVNIIVRDDADADALFEKINKENPIKNDTGIRRINETTDLSYPKRLIEVRTPSGVIAEMQIITDKAYLAKDGIKGFTGGNEQVKEANKELDKIRKRLGWNIPDGLGHYFYEIQRDTNIDQSLRDEAKRLSNEYYDAFTNENSKLKESPFMGDVNKFRENVDKADKKNWDKGNTGKAPESLIKYKSKSSLAPKSELNDIIKKGRASGFSDAAIKIVLKKKGFSEADIDTAIKTEIGAAKKVTISEETAPGFDRMMTQVENIVNKSKKRGVSEEKIADNAMNYVMGSKVYENATDVQREKIIRDIEKKFGIKQKPSPKAEKILGIKEPAKITISEKEALKNQIKAEAKGAKNAVSAWRKASAVVSKMIKDMKKSGSITTTQAANVLRKFSGVNVLSSESIGRYVDYMSKVFADAEYANKLSVALESRKAISKLSKNKDKNANLRALGDKFKQIDPAMVEDIDEYNRTASLIKESIKGSTYRGATVMPAQMVNINEAMDYTEKTMKAQDKKMAEIKAAEIQEIMGIDASELSYEQMLQLLDSKEPITKYNEGIIRDTINRMFDVYSSMIDSMIESGIDPMTGEPVELSKTQKELVKKFMEMDLNKLTPKEALSAVDALNNFIVNKSTAKMETVVRQYTGDTNAINLADKGVKSKPLQMYWIKGVGRFFGEQFASLPTLIERMFKGVMAGAKIEKASGLTDVKNGKAEAESNSNRIVEEYVDKFYKEKANGEAFNTEANVTERGIVSFMSRSVTGTEEEIQQDFNRRKKLIEESIDALSKGSEKEQAKAELYKAAYDKVLKDSYSAEDVRRKADKKNLEAVDFWIDKWSSIYDQLSDVSENVYNKILDKDIDYTPDRFTRLERAQEEIDLDSDQSVFHGNTNTLYKKETGVLMKAERPESLPKDDKGKKPAMYIDLSFDKNNANSMYDALVDINTAGPIRQVQSFLNSEGFDRMVPEVKDAKVLKERVKLYISNIRKKNAFDNDEMSAMMRKLNTISAIGVGQALGGILQPFKQTIPVAMNTLVNAGGLDIGSIFNSSKMNFIDNSGYAIANRGIESQTQLKSINKLMDLAAESKGIKALKYIEKANKIWLDIFLVKPDSFIARASWMSYYEQSLKKQGIDPGGIDYNTHKINKEAADYAQTMVDRQQNISDSDLQGKLFSSKTALSQLFVKTLLPFANFRMNQFMRLTNDITTLTSMTSSKEDKVIAARSLGGYSVEVATFTAISTAAGMLLYELSKTMMGEGEDEEEEERRKSNMIKGQITGRVTDILSPLPFLDKPIAAGVNMAMDKVQEAMDIVKEDRLSIYGDTKVDMVKSLGTLGITLERGAQLYDLYDLARTGEYTDSYGNVKKISESSRAYLEGMTAAALLTNIGLAPSEVNNIVRNSIKLAKSTGKTEKTIEREIKAEENKTESRLLLNELKEQETDPELIDAIDKRISELEDKSEVAKEKRKARKEEKERLLQGYKNMDEMKRYDPELYEETFGEGSDYYEKHKDEVLINKAYNKLERQKRDEEMDYIPSSKKSKKKKSFGSKGFGTKGFGSKGFGSKGS